MPDSTTRYFTNQTQTPPDSTREPGALISTPVNTPDTSNPTPTPLPIEPASPGDEEIFANENDIFYPETGQGRILVRAQTALGALPVSEATVIVSRTRDGTKEVVNFQLTDKSGKTPEITVPAPPKVDSQSPSESLPFADYSITVRNPLYYTAITDNVQVFGDELTVLTQELTPLPELINETDITRTVNIPRQNL